ncbi:hypothetical protein V8G54_016997 [Vigna mungo]|uniref:Uncharacterized protein n=1 Tax=Vigna mungo TaxID=3915 RepID=A0AAQ3RZV7_VIGMU
MVPPLGVVTGGIMAIICGTSTMRLRAACLRFRNADNWAIRTEPRKHTQMPFIHIIIAVVITIIITASPNSTNPRRPQLLTRQKCHGRGEVHEMQPTGHGASIQGTVVNRREGPYGIATHDLIGV